MKRKTGDDPGRRSARVRRAGATAVVLAVAAGAVPARAPAQEEGRGPPSVPVDRWLVAGPLDAGSDSVPRVGAPPVEGSGVLPDRGLEVGGDDASPGAPSDRDPRAGGAGDADGGEPVGAGGRVTGAPRWSLLREDSVETFSIGPSAAGGSRAYLAHAYVRSSSDRSVRLRVRGPECSGVTVRLNGQDLAAPSDPAATLALRLARGWNTLQLRLTAGDCPVAFGAVLLPGWDGLAGIRVQASRPPGDVPALPEPWVEPGATLRAGTPMTWRDGALAVPLGLPLAAWGPAPVDSVQVRARVGSADLRLAAAGLRPAADTTLAVTVSLADARRAALEGARLELRWSGRESKPVVPVSAASVLRAIHAPIRLEGWGGGAAAGAEPPLPAVGEARGGSWKVPAELAGLGLLLDASDSPGSFRIGDGAAAETDAGPIPLCDPCREGETIVVHAAPSAPWSAYPHARVAKGGWPAAGPGAPPPETWLRALGRDGNAEYRELSARHAGAGAAAREDG